MKKIKQVFGVAAALAVCVPGVCFSQLAGPSERMHEEASWLDGAKKSEASASVPVEARTPTLGQKLSENTAVRMLAGGPAAAGHLMSGVISDYYGKNNSRPKALLKAAAFPLAYPFLQSKRAASLAWNDIERHRHNFLGGGERELSGGEKAVQYFQTGLGAVVGFSLGVIMDAGMTLCSTVYAVFNPRGDSPNW